jgi:hypothetical protein
VNEAGNACEICGTGFEKQRDICVDHCHSTRAVRGVLCTTCNAGIGMLKDDIGLLEKAIVYLRRRRGG